MYSYVYFVLLYKPLLLYKERNWFGPGLVHVFGSLSLSVSQSSPSPRPILWDIKCFESTRHLSLALYIKTRMTRHCASPPAFVSPKTIACTHHTVLFQLYLFRQKKVIMPLHTQQPPHHLYNHLLAAQSVPVDNSCALNSRILPSSLSAPLPRR